MTSSWTAPCQLKKLLRAAASTAGLLCSCSNDTECVKVAQGAFGLHDFTAPQLLRTCHTFFMFASSLIISSPSYPTSTPPRPLPACLSLFLVLAGSWPERPANEQTENPHQSPLHLHGFFRHLRGGCAGSKCLKAIARRTSVTDLQSELGRRLQPQDRTSASDCESICKKVVRKQTFTHKTQVKECQEPGSSTTTEAGSPLRVWQNAEIMTLLTVLEEQKCTKKNTSRAKKRNA